MNMPVFIAMQMRERRQDLVLLKDELRTEKMMVAVDAR